MDRVKEEDAPVVGKGSTEGRFVASSKQLPTQAVQSKLSSTLSSSRLLLTVTPPRVSAPLTRLWTPAQNPTLCKRARCSQVPSCGTAVTSVLGEDRRVHSAGTCSGGYGF